MRSIIAIFASGLIGLTGCGRQQTDKAVGAIGDAPSRFLASDPRLMEFLKGIYERHGAKAELAGDWVIVDGGKLRTRAVQFNHRQYPQGLVLQVDFISVLPSGQRIIESFAGTGTNLNAALKDACANFQGSTFHALHSAILGRHSDQAEVQNLEIGGIPRVVTFGSVGTRGKVPADSWPEIYSALEAQLKSSGLPRGLHWVRYYYGHLPTGGGPPEIEVLLDNMHWTEQQTKAAAFPWPVSEKFYSIRTIFCCSRRMRPSRVTKEG